MNNHEITQYKKKVGESYGKGWSHGYTLGIGSSSEEIIKIEKTIENWIDDDSMKGASYSVCENNIMGGEKDSEEIAYRIGYLNGFKDGCDNQEFKIA